LSEEKERSNDVKKNRGNSPILNSSGKGGRTGGGGRGWKGGEKKATGKEKGGALKSGGSLGKGRTQPSKAQSNPYLLSKSCNRIKHEPEELARGKKGGTVKDFHRRHSPGLREFLPWGKKRKDGGLAASREGRDSKGRRPSGKKRGRTERSNFCKLKLKKLKIAPQSAPNVGQNAGKKKERGHFLKAGTKKTMENENRTGKQIIRMSRKSKNVDGNDIRWLGDPSLVSERAEKRLKGGQRPGVQKQERIRELTPWNERGRDSHQRKGP